MESIGEQIIKSKHKVVMYNPRIVGGQVGKNHWTSLEFSFPNSTLIFFICSSTWRQNETSLIISQQLMIHWHLRLTKTCCPTRNSLCTIDKEQEEKEFNQLFWFWYDLIWCMFVKTMLSLSGIINKPTTNFFSYLNWFIIINQFFFSGFVCL